MVSDQEVSMKNFSVLLFIFIVLILPVQNIYAQSVWRESTYEDFIDGQFDDAGANMYVSHKANIQMNFRTQY